MQNLNVARPHFIDIFAGAGGLSLGLMQAGWRGLFAVEKSPMAFETLSYNLVDQADNLGFDWPGWLPKIPIDIKDLVEDYRAELEQLRGIDLVGGGPPCQGYSVSGRRNREDERNTMINYYLALIEIVQPRFLLVENVRGFAIPFKGDDDDEEGFNAAEMLKGHLEGLGYTVFSRRELMAKDFGVPQLRPRYVLIGIQSYLLQETPDLDPFVTLNEMRPRFLADKGLPVERPVSLEEAISDLERRHGSIVCIEPHMKNFQQGKLGPNKSAYQGLMRRTRDGQPIQADTLADSHRFPNHKPETIKTFERIQLTCEPGFNIGPARRKELGLRDHRVALCARDKPCHTLTTLPDDLVHYSEPRVPTVREYARIQSFPDWFAFKSVYTTGGEDRKSDVPRYTQAANAVPPLLAEAIGAVLLGMYNRLLPDIAYQDNRQDVDHVATLVES